MVDDFVIGGDDQTGLVWLADARENRHWYEALADLDVRGDKKPLVESLLSGQVPPPSIAYYIGDLLDRYTLKRSKKRPRTPAYLRTAEQVKLIAAVVEVHRRVHRDREPLAAALQDVAAYAGLSEETLTAAYSGKHGGLQRAARRWPPFRS